MTIFNPHIVNYIVIQLSIQKCGIGNLHFYWNVVCLKIKPQSVYTSCDILNPFRFFFRKSWLKMERELEKLKLYAYKSYGFKFTHISCDILNQFRFFLKIMVQNGKGETMKLCAYNSYVFKFSTTHISKIHQFSLINTQSLNQV